jgi:predicted GNAT family acetyltransferase
MTPRHEPEQQRFTLATTPASVLDYRLEAGRVVFTHTGVPAACQGQGLAARLVEAGLQWAQAQGLKVVPACSYVQSYLQRHPQWQSLVA